MQFGILTGRYAELLWNDRQRLALLLIQPLLIAILLKIVADKDIFKIYESTKSMLFALSCSGIWIGMFNSIQEICKERVILKREYMSNLKLPCYMMSKFVLQALLGLIQSIILTLVFLSLVGNSKKEFSSLISDRKCYFYGMADCNCIGCHGIYYFICSSVGRQSDGSGSIRSDRAAFI